MIKRSNSRRKLFYIGIPLIYTLALSIVFLLLSKYQVSAVYGFYCSSVDESTTNWCQGPYSTCNCSDGYYDNYCTKFYHSIVCSTKVTIDCYGYAYECSYDYTPNYYNGGGGWCGGTCQSCSLPGCNTGYNSSTNYGCGSYGVSCTKYYSTCTNLSCGTSSGTCYKNAYNVTINANSGTCTNDDHSACYQSSSLTPGCTRTGYTLAGYSLTAGACGGTFNSSTGVCSSVTQAISIDALWTINSYEVSVTSNGGSCTPGTHSVNYGSASQTQSCSWTDHQFDYFTQSGCGGAFNSSTGVCSSVTGPMSMTANWKYLVTVNANGGNCTNDDHYVSYNSSSLQPTCTRTNYTVSYSLTGTCGGTFSTTTGVCSAITSNITITADWTPTNNTPYDPSSLYTNGVTNPTNVTTSNPTFSAIFSDPDASDTGNYYEIEVNTASDFTGTFMWDSGIQQYNPPITNGLRTSNVTYDGSWLDFTGTTYYWRIRLGDNWGAMSGWTSAQFTMHTNTTPTAPTNLQTEQSTNPTGVSDLTPEFRAIFNDPDTTDTSSKYEIEVNTNNTFTGTVMWDSGIQNMTSTPEGSYSPDIPYAGIQLNTDGTTYYWRIRFVDNYESISPWSSTAQFTMNTSPLSPDAPYCEGTTNPPNVSTTLPKFSAIFKDSDVGDTGTHYEIEVSTQSDFVGISMWNSNQQSMTPVARDARCANIIYNGSTLSTDGSQYYWRIRFWDNHGTIGAWSATQNFVMQRQPSPPTNLLTDGNTNPSFIKSLTPSFSAIHNDVNGSTASYYEVQVNSNNLFTGTFMWESGKQSMTTTSDGARSPDIIYAGTTLTGTSSIVYYWRIRFWDSDNLIGDWSDTAQFTDTLNNQYFKGLKMKGLQLN